jgi:hypothetical protein
MRRGRAVAAHCRAVRSSEGQAAVETIALLPVLALVAASVGQFLAAGAAATMAGHAAEAGAVAIVEGADPVAAVGRALPGWPRSRVQITVAGRRVSVRLHPPALIPGLGALLDATSNADAGPAI